MAERRELIKRGKAPAYDARQKPLSAPELAESCANGDASDSEESVLSEISKLTDGELQEGDSSSEPDEDGSASREGSGGDSLDRDVEMDEPVTDGAGSDGSAGETTEGLPAPLDPDMQLLDEVVFPVVLTWYPLPEGWITASQLSSNGLGAQHSAAMMPLPPPVGRTREQEQAFKAWLLNIARTYPRAWEVLVGTYLREVVRPRVVAGLGGAPLHVGSFWREWEPDVLAPAVRQLRPEMAPTPFSFPKGPEGEILESLAAQIMDGNEDLFQAANQYLGGGAVCAR